MKTIAVNNVKHAYSINGNGSKTIILIHGYPLDQTMWNDQVQSLSSIYKTVTYDIRGFGKSESGTEKFSIPLFASDLKALCDQLELQQPVLCGFSMGGYIALQCAVTHPDYFGGLILHDTQCNADTPEARQQRYDSIEFINKNGVSKYAGPFIRKMITAKSLQNTKLVSWLEKTINQCSEEQLSSILEALANRPETCNMIADLSIPVLIIRGMEDVIISHEKTELMKNKFRNSTVKEIPQAGHLSNLEQPDLFNNLLLDFMKYI